MYLARLTKSNTFFFYICIMFTCHQDFLLDSYCPYCYKILSNHFHKSITSIKVINSINSTVKMHQFQKNGLFTD